MFGLLYWRRPQVPCLILKKTSRRTQAVVVSEGIYFLCGALLCNFLSTEHEGLSTHVQREWSAEPFMPSILSLNLLYSSIIEMQIQSSSYCCCVCVVFPSHSFWTSNMKNVGLLPIRCAERKILEDGGSTLPRGATFLNTPELKLIHLSD